MAQFLDSSAPDFAARFQALISSKLESRPEIGSVVSAILADVKARGDLAVIELTAKFDNLQLTPQTMRVDPETVAGAFEEIDSEVREALLFAHGRIKAHHEKQKPQDQIYTDADGVTLGSRWTAVESAGIYVPGGLASYPSSVLMNAVPAKVAGVPRIAMAVPARDGLLNPAVLAAAHIAGVNEIYQIGGAQAIAALAFGTQTIAPVVKITGPGNAYVAEAKRQVFGTVGIDIIAGPSEVLVLADRSANPSWIAADLIAQAEHGAGAQAVAMVVGEGIAEAVGAEVERQLALLESDEARKGWDTLGAVIKVGSLDEGFALANQMAPEHLELAIDEAARHLPKVFNAGAVFLGHHTPEAVGDYVGGTNHVLPTARSARFSSGLSVYDFMKRISVLGCDPEALGRLADATVALATAEGLVGHARSVQIRRNR